MPLQIHCPHCFQSLLLPYTEAGLRVKCPNCQAPITVTAADDGSKPKQTERMRPAAADLWFFKAEDGSDFGPVSKQVLDQWFDEGRVSADCQILHVGDEQWHWASDLFPELDDGQGAIAQGAPVNRYDISDLLPPVVGVPSYPAGMYGLPGSGAPMPTMGTAAMGPIAEVPRMTRRLTDCVDPNLASSSLYLDTLDKIEHRRGGHHPLVVATAVLNFIFGTYAMILGLFSFVMAVYNSTGAKALIEGDWSFWAPMLPLALAGYAAFVLQTAIGLLNYQSWTIMATYMQAAVSMTVSIVIICIPVWLAFPPLLIFAISGLVYGVLASIAVSIPWVVEDFD